MRILVLLAVIWIAVLPASAIPESVTVHLFESHGPISSVLVEGPLEILDANRLAFPRGKFLIKAAQHSVQLIESKSGTVSARLPKLRIRGASANGLSICVQAQPCRAYRGVIEFRSKRGFLEITNEVSALDYVTSVVGSESLPDWPVEMLKAQAVVTQTRLFRHRKSDYLGDSTNKEAYLGASYERPLVLRAVRAVWGKALVYNGVPTVPLYHSTCAGGTSDGAKYFGRSSTAIPYLIGVKCDFCRNSPFYKPLAKTVPRKAFEGKFGIGVPTIVSKDAADRPLKVEYKNGAVETGYDLWLKVGQKLGWDKLPGTRFSIKSAPESVMLVSTGAGHGIGMCQWGAAELALQGKSYSNILKYYYPGTSIARQ
jgi:stage II sporulation protein D